MTHGEHIFAALSTNPAVIALVGTRVFPNVAPADAEVPFIVYRVWRDVAIRQLAGGTADLMHGTVQVDAYSRTYDEAHAVAAAAETVLDGYDAAAFASQFVNSRDLYEDETKLERVMLTFSMWRK